MAEQKRIKYEQDKIANLWKLKWYDISNLSNIIWKVIQLLSIQDKLSDDDIYNINTTSRLYTKQELDYSFLKNICKLQLFKEN